MNIFPTLKIGKWIKINLNEESKKTNLDLSNPDNCTNFVNRLNKNKKVDYSYGGYLEDRTYIWRNHPNEKSSSLIHLGVDYSVPAGTEVCLPMKGTVFHIMNDPDNKLGWGGRIIWKLEDGTYLLYGHLKQDIKLKVGQICNKGEVVALIGDTNENGNWWPHLHAQLMTQTFIDNYEDELEEIDGYLSKGNVDINHIINPEELIQLMQLQ